MWDVIVVGGAPSGAIAAKKCAEQNFKTLLLEKRGLPREKVCTGMLMSPMAQNTIQHEFGDIPEEGLTTPRQDALRSHDYRQSHTMLQCKYPHGVLVEGDKGCGAEGISTHCAGERAFICRLCFSARTGLRSSVEGCFAMS